MSNSAQRFVTLAMIGLAVFTISVWLLHFMCKHAALIVACRSQIYKAERPHWPVRVYNLLYEDSQEADKFAAAVAREVNSPGCISHGRLHDVQLFCFRLSQMPSEGTTGASQSVASCLLL